MRDPAPHRHLTVHELFRLLGDGTSPHGLARRGLAHLCTLCPECDAAFQSFERVRDRRRRRRPRSYAAVFHATERRLPGLMAVHQAEVEAAEEDFRLLLDRHHADAMALITDHRRRQADSGPRGWRMRSPVLARRLLEEARIALRRSPAEALERVEQAEAVVQRAPRPTYGERFVEGLVTRAMADRANVLRVMGELQGADAHWRLVHDRLERWPVDDDDEADLASLEASLRQDQRRFVEADRLLVRAERRYRRLEDVEGVGKVLIQRGNLADLQDRSRDAARLYRQAAEVLGREAFPRQHLAAQHNLALAFCNLGEPEAAAAIVAENRPRYVAGGDGEAAGLLAWIGGRIAWGLGDSEKAAARLLEARNGYVSRRQGYSAALVTLDLAALHLERGRPREVKQLAEQMVPIFQAQDIHRELIAALMLFQQAAHAEKLTADLLSRLPATCCSPRTTRASASRRVTPPSRWRRSPRRSCRGSGPCRPTVLGRDPVVRVRVDHSLPASLPGRKNPSGLQNRRSESFRLKANRRSTASSRHRYSQVRIWDTPFPSGDADGIRPPGALREGSWIMRRLATSLLAVIIAVSLFAAGPAAAAPSERVESSLSVWQSLLDLLRPIFGANESDTGPHWDPNGFNAPPPNPASASGTAEGGPNGMQGASPGGPGSGQADGSAEMHPEGQR